VRARTESKTERPLFKALLWTAFAGLIFGLIGFGEVDDLLRAGRNSLHWHKASGDIVLVKIDDQSLRAVGRWPWPRRYQAQLVDRLTNAGANRIFFDILFDGHSNPSDDAAFAGALKRSGRVVLAVMARSGPNSGPGAGHRQDAIPLPEFTRYAKLGVLSVKYNFQNAVWHIPYAIDIQGKPMPHFTALLSGVRGKVGEEFTPDYSLDPKSIPTFSATNVLNGRFDRHMVQGKDVIIGTTTDVVGDQYFLPGTGKTGGVYVHIIGAETLKAGAPISIGWVPSLLLALAAAAFATKRRNPMQQFGLLGLTFVLLLFGPAALDAHLIFAEVTPGLFVILIFTTILGRRYLRQRGEVNAVSGLSNLNALQGCRAGTDQALIVARIWNYAEVVATLPSDSERQLVDQIIGRLSVGTSDRTLYHGDSGIFAWFEEGRMPFGHHIDALYALFRNPVRVSGLSIDLAISFGVEIGSGRSLANRLASALVAAEESAHDGLKWKYHDPDTFENASWKLSMLSQLDSAIDNDEVWIAFQPKLELKTRRIIGAEVLARWTHPDKGPIAASEFVAAAEQHDRIGKLTDFVLDKAVSAAAAINKRGEDFDVAVNLSARLLSDKQFVMRVAAVLARHGLDARHLTLELTETAELAARGDSLDTLTRLRELGVQISIDDYGTGLSTLDYLKKIPATEIKIDQSFVKGLCDNRSDRLMVHSTIGLAHSLGRKVVAEGVEHREILDELLEMECDIAQGFIIGRPMSLDSLVKRLSSERGRSRRVA
jgi:EAL domain-containing protein (putative c-di-GMP-specific phosphodiesterase class I)/CHASE2 domain-containing sensor protein